MFILFIGFSLGLLIALISAGFFSAPAKSLLKIFLNSLTGILVLCAINIFANSADIYIDLNPLTAVYVGILGFPGTLSLIVLSLII